jgi:transcriptional regulator GlxA family with amidase domain
MPSDNKNELRLSLVIYQHVLATGLTLPLEMLLAGEAFAHRYDNSAVKLKSQLVSQESSAVTSRAGLAFAPDVVLNEQPIALIDVPDIILVPSLWRNPRPVLRKHKKLIDWLHHCWQNGAI